MQIFQTILHAPALDMAALVLIVLAWACTGWIIENPPKNRPSVTVSMQKFRREWMQTMVMRSPRIFDATLIDSHRQSSAFFASASMIAIGGGAALIGNSQTVHELAGDLPIDDAQIALTLKLLLPLAFMATALLKFIWSHRLFGYCSILMAAVPNHADHPLAFARAAQAAEINITAGKSYNRGMRAIYFALAALAWVMGAGVLLIATVIATLVMLRREFRSESRAVIVGGP